MSVLSPPAFSIIVPVHNVRAYLRACLDSLLTQSFTDFELIAVDDTSPDGSGEILDEYAAADERVRVLHLAQNVGLGLARNAGLDVARGKYLLFVDSDDLVTPGYLQAIASRIAETAEPDVVVFDYARMYWTGKQERNIMGWVLADEGPDVFTAKDRPNLLRNLMVVWNKAYRREWIEQLGLRFHTGFYEDLPWTYPVMISAQRITTLDQVCYLYRQRRHGNILRSRSDRHLEVFDQYDHVFAYLDAHPEVEEWRRVMFDRMIEHLLSILHKDSRLHASQWRAFFDRFAAAYDKYRPAGYAPPAGRRGAKIRAVAGRSYPAFRAVHLSGVVARNAHRTYRASRKSAKNTARKARDFVLRRYYTIQRHLPLDEHLAVYAAYWTKAYGCNPAAIYAEAARIAPQVRGLWIVRKDFVRVIPDGVPYVNPASFGYYRAMARAKFFVNNVNFANDIVKRPGQVHIQTQHGTPLKKMGLDLMDHPMGAANLDFREMLDRSDRWDYVLSSNRHSSEVWERSIPCDYTTLEFGYPRNDQLVRATADDVAAARAALKLPSDKTVILYAPTFRDWSRNNFIPPVDLAAFCKRLGDGFVLLVRGHYFTGSGEGVKHLQAAGTLRDVSKHASVEELMIASDVLLTDYSSIQFDFANLDRPIVIYADDWDTYVRARGVTFDLMASPPGVVETTLDGLADAFRSGRYRDAATDHLRKEFRKRFCQFEDGHAAERVLRHVFLGETPVTSGAAHSTGVTQTEDLDDDRATDDEVAQPDALQQD
jgi:CDP-glycerol glycerophosphotransferase